MTDYQVQEDFELSGETLKAGDIIPGHSFTGRELKSLMAQGFILPAGYFDVVEEAEPKPKRKRKAKAEEPEPSIDEMIEELVNDD